MSWFDFLFIKFISWCAPDSFENALKEMEVWEKKIIHTLFFRVKFWVISRDDWWSAQNSHRHQKPQSSRIPIPSLRILPTLQDWWDQTRSGQAKCVTLICIRYRMFGWTRVLQTWKIILNQKKTSVSPNFSKECFMCVCRKLGSAHVMLCYSFLLKDSWCYPLWDNIHNLVMFYIDL